jgi:hypothetical protein
MHNCIVHKFWRMHSFLENYRILWNFSSDLSFHAHDCVSEPLVAFIWCYTYKKLAPRSIGALGVPDRRIWRLHKDKRSKWTQLQLFLPSPRQSKRRYVQSCVGQVSLLGALRRMALGKREDAFRPWERTMDLGRKESCAPPCVLLPLQQPPADVHRSLGQSRGGSGARPGRGREGFLCC